MEMAIDQPLTITILILRVGLSNTWDSRGKSHLLCWLHREGCERADAHTLPAPGTKHPNPTSWSGDGKEWAQRTVTAREEAEEPGLQPSHRPLRDPQSSQSTFIHPSRPHWVYCLPSFWLWSSICDVSPAHASRRDASQMETIPSSGAGSSCPPPPHRRALQSKPRQLTVPSGLGSCLPPAPGIPMPSLARQRHTCEPCPWGEGGKGQPCYLLTC